MAEITISITGETTDLRFQQLVKALGFQLCIEGNPEVKRIPMPMPYSEKKRGWPKGKSRKGQPCLHQIGPDPSRVPEPMNGVFKWQVLLKNKHTRDVKNFIMDGRSKDDVEKLVIESLGKDYEIMSIAPEVASAEQG
jgi:hypothetical protein